MATARVPRRIGELPEKVPADGYFGVHLTFDDRLLLTYEAGSERCLDELIDGSWHPRFRAGPSKPSWFFAQLLADETLILVHSRTPGPEAPNAVLVDSGGRELDRRYLGDGIGHCQADGAGNIWVGYFDEGIYGDQDLGHQGLVKFGPAGRPEFQFLRDAGHLPVIDDCYALNVSGGDEAWLCYYSSFVLVQVRANKAELMLTDVPVHGSGAVMLDRKRRSCGFWSSYKKDSRIQIVDLETKSCTRLPLRTEDGDRFPRWAGAARGGRLILRHGRRLYEFDLNIDL